MIEILTVLEIHDDYSKYCSMVEKHTTDNDIKRVITWIKRYYDDTGYDTIDWSMFETYFFAKNPMIKDAKKSIFEAIFAKLSAFSMPTLKSVLVTTYLQRYHAERIAFEALEVAEGKRGTLEDIQQELDSYIDLSGKAESIGNEANTDDLSTILTRVSHGTGLTWRMNCLNDSLGPIRKGNFILFGGRPDSGKTTLLCSEATHMAQQLPDEQYVLYFTNEEGSDAVKVRAICSLLGVTLKDLEADPLTCWSEYVRILGGNKDKILIIDKSDLTMSEIEWWLKRKEAGLIVIDQLRKVKGFEDYSGVNRLEKLFNHTRELSKKYAPVITVTQLDGGAEGIAFPNMSHLYESKTAVQGEMDAIINIGRVDGSVPPNARYLNVVKNKLPTPGDPAQRNYKHEVILSADIARFT